jgi:hypothetical protein
MGKSPLLPQSRKVLYGIIGIALLIGAVLIIASVGQQLTTIMSSGNATQTAQIDLEETALATDAPTQFPITNPTIQSHASPTSARPSATRQPEFNFPTETAQIDLPENVSILEVSEATNVQVIDQSGAVIGNGLLRVYYASNVSPQNTTRVELELRFVEKFITATPFSDVTRIPVTAVTSTPQPMRPTATPRVPQHEESGVQVQQLMGASLFCLPESFSGCDESADPTAYAFIQEGGAFWSWTLRPQANIGVHDLRLELWTLLSVNGQTRPNTVWQYPFSITIGEAPVTSDSDPIRSILIVLVGTIGIVAMVVVFYIQKRSTNTPIQKSATGKNPTVFLSYRRKVSWAVALKLHESLSQMGADVFMDMEDLGEGQFANKLMEEIQSRDYFVLLLAPDTLSSEWVMREAQYAMKAGKRIIPVLTDGFQLSEENLPPDLKSISSHNAVTLTLEFYDAGIKRIAKFLGL